MGFLKEIGNAIRNEWRKMTVSDKVKIGVRILCAIGSGSICGVAARKYIESEHPGTFETAAVVTTAVGVAWKMNDVAYNAWCDQIDNFTNLKQACNELGDEVEHEEVVG